MREKEPTERRPRISDRMREVTIGTYTGKLVHPFEFRNGEIDIRDIAMSLSHSKFACRFRGHTLRWYCVAQHSTETARFLEGYDPLTRMGALLHDASEAYLPDLASPFKRVMPSFRRYEGIIQRQINRFYLGGDLASDQARLIKWADLVMLATEARDLMRRSEDWDLPLDIHPLTKWRGPIEPAAAREEFILAFHRLQTEWEEANRRAQRQLIAH